MAKQKTTNIVGRLITKVKSILNQVNANTANIKSLSGGGGAVEEYTFEQFKAKTDWTGYEGRKLEWIQGTTSTIFEIKEANKRHITAGHTDTIITTDSWTLITYKISYTMAINKFTYGSGYTKINANQNEKPVYNYDDYSGAVPTKIIIHKGDI